MLKSGFGHNLTAAENRGHPIYRAGRLFYKKGLIDNRGGLTANLHPPNAASGIVQLSQSCPENNRFEYDQTHPCNSRRTTASITSIPSSLSLSAGR